MMIDLGIVLAFVIYSVSVGFAMQKKASRGLVDYFLAGRSLKGWQAGFSMAATQYAADTPLLVTGLIATAGIFSLWRLWIYALAFLMMGFVLGPCWRRAQVLTDAELTEFRYAGTGATVLRALKAIHLGTIVNCTVLAMVLTAAVRIAEPFLPWHHWLHPSVIRPIAGALETLGMSITTLPVTHPEVWNYSANNFISIALILIFTTLYSTTGGLRSVVATDVVQFSIAMIATCVYAAILITEMGGFAALGEKLAMLYGPEVRNAIFSFGPSDLSQLNLAFLTVLGVQWFAQVNADGTGYLAQRTMACREERQAKIAAIVFTVAQILFRSLLWIPIALALLVLYPAQELLTPERMSETFRIQREGTFAWGIRDFLPVGIRGLMLTGMLAALASTVDTHLNWGASYWTNDLYKRVLMEKWLRREPNQRELIWIARGSNLLILSVALLIMANINSIQEAWHLSLLFGSGVGLVMILRWIWYRINLWSEIAAGVVSLISAPVLLIYFPDLSEMLRLLILVGISTATVLLVTIYTRPEPLEKLTQFYRQVRPPGFWKPVALACGESPKQSTRVLKRTASATLLAALSIFMLLVGVGSLFLRGFSENGLAWFFVLAGFSLWPLWWRLGMNSGGDDRP